MESTIEAPPPAGSTRLKRAPRALASAPRGGRKGGVARAGAKAKAPRGKKPAKEPIPGPSIEPIPGPSIEPIPRPVVEPLSPIILPSSPPIIEPQPEPELEPEERQFDLDLEYILRVNGNKVTADTKFFHSSYFMLSIVEDDMMELILNPASTINGRAYSWISRMLTFRVDTTKATQKPILLKDFSDTIGELALQKMRVELNRFPEATRVRAKIEVRIKCEAIQKAFHQKSANEPSSDHQPDTPTYREPRRTQQLLTEARNRERAEAVKSAVDNISLIHERWLCKEARCDNYPHWCWVKDASKYHFTIKEADAESWANKILEGESGVSVNMPPIRLQQYFRGTGNKLKVNPHNGRRRKNRRSSSSSSESESLRRMIRKMEKQQQLNRMRRMAEEEDERSDRREQRKLDLEARREVQGLHQMPTGVNYQFAHRAPLYQNGWPQAFQQPFVPPYGPQYYPHLSAAPPPVAATTPGSRREKKSQPYSSSPIASRGGADTRKTVEEFLN